MRYLYHGIFGLLLLALLSSCEKLFEYNPNEVNFSKTEKHQTRENLKQLSENKSGDKPLRFAVISDTQNFYDDLYDAVKEINQEKNLDFVLHAGDITQFGISSDYKLVNRLAAKDQCSYHFKYPWPPTYI